MEKIFGTKLDPYIEPTPQETHLAPSALRPFLKLDFVIFVWCFTVRKRMFESELLKRFEVQLNTIFRYGTT